MKIPKWYYVAAHRVEKLWCWCSQHWIKSSIFVLGPIAFATELGAVLIKMAAALFALWFFSLAFSDKDPNANWLMNILQSAAKNIVGGLSMLLATLLIVGLMIGLAIVKAVDISITVEQLRAPAHQIRTVDPDSLF